MNAVGKIGVLLPEIVDSLDYELLQGIHTQAKKLGYDVLVFTDTFNAMAEIYHDDYIGGQENIYNLALSGKLDGILFTAERFHNAKVRKRIYAECKALSIPCLVLEQENNMLPFVTVSQTEPTKRMTEHLILTHNCRRLYFLAGKKNNCVSQQRMEGFYQSMAEHGLHVDESMIFYGDFWKEKPYKLGLDIASGKVPKPDAVVCASDFMATALCDALTENGVSVPGDVAVTGYDGDWTALLNTPQITTIAGREAELGVLAVCRLYKMMTGNTCPPPQSCQHLRCGTSCGCTVNGVFPEPSELLSLENYVKSMMSRPFDRKNFMAADYVSKTSDVETPEQLAKRIESLTNTLDGAEWQEICLCDDWKFDFENPDKFRKEGFSDKMLLALSKRPATTIEDMTMFPADVFLPALQKPHEPQLVVFTSLHHRSQIFGYVSRTYRNVKDIFADAHYINWCDAIAGMLDTMQKKQYQAYIRQQLDALSVVDPDTGLYNKRGLMEQLPNFPAHSEKSTQSHMCMLISYVQKHDISAQFGGEPELMIANALRLSSNEDELLCRLQDNVFAVILPILSENTEQLAQERIMRLEEKIRYMQGSVLQLQMPELVTDYSPMQFDKISKAGSFIEEKQQFILRKAEEAAFMTGNYKKRLYRLRREIHAAPQKNWSIEEMAHTVGISPSHFQRMYKIEFGVSCKDDVITVRMEKAKQLLQDTELRVQEVAAACSYSDSSHFMRQFKKKTGVSALQYRKQKNT